MKKFILLLSATITLAPFAVQALDFNLFDANRGKEPVVEKPKPAPVAPKPLPKPPAPPKKQIDFMLLGTQIIGARKVAYLQTPNGNNIRQTLNSNGATPIAGFRDYILRSVGTREVQIAYPSDAPCQENRDEKGVKCENPTLATLSLKRGKRTPPRIPKPMPVTPPSAAHQQQAPQQGQPFQPRIIKDEEIPPGMKRIRTPFGDRLVPAQ